jgi:hypothetical protein
VRKGNEKSHASYCTPSITCGEGLS